MDGQICFVQDALLMLRDERQLLHFLLPVVELLRRGAANGSVRPNGSEQTLCHAGPGGLESKLITCAPPPPKHPPTPGHESHPFTSHLTIQTQQTDSINTPQWIMGNISMSDTRSSHG